jgi:hypothetical protein
LRRNFEKLTKPKMQNAITKTNQSKSVNKKFPFHVLDPYAHVAFPEQDLSYKPPPEPYKPEPYEPEPYEPEPYKPEPYEPEPYVPPSSSYHEPEPYHPPGNTYHEPEPYQPPYEEPGKFSLDFYE